MHSHPTFVAGRPLAANGWHCAVRDALLATLHERPLADATAHAVLEAFLPGYSRVSYLLRTPLVAAPGVVERLYQALERMQAHEPLQYVLGVAAFGGHRFVVKPGVLIPRPETEEMVDYLINLLPQSLGRILDIGTGSGCIAISLQKAYPAALVDAVEMSVDALAVARHNASALGASIQFLQMDFLRSPLPALQWDLMVSNPPYVCLSERAGMAPNVLQYEPAEALFVADNDPLCFYKRIAAAASTSLAPGGHLCVEINEAFGPAVVDLLTATGLSAVTLHQDLQQKDRWVVARRGEKLVPQ